MLNRKRLRPPGWRLKSLALSREPLARIRARLRYRALPRRRVVRRRCRRRRIRRHGRRGHRVAGAVAGVVDRVAGLVGSTVHGVTGLVGGAIHRVAGAVGGVLRIRVGAVHRVAGLVAGAIHRVVGLLSRGLVVVLVAAGRGPREQAQSHCGERGQVLPHVAPPFNIVKPAPDIAKTVPSASFSPNPDVTYQSTPTTHAPIRVASAPPTIASSPSRDRSCRRVGARTLIPPIWIPTLAKFANPHKA